MCVFANIFPCKRLIRRNIALPFINFYKAYKNFYKG